jgi:hypothetical protein
MTTPETPNRADRARVEHEELMRAIPPRKPPLPPDLTRGLQVDDSWTKETAKALDLSDAMQIGFRSTTPEESKALEDVVGSFRTYMSKLTTLLQTMQGILIENITHVEEMQNYFNRLR